MNKPERKVMSMVPNKSYLEGYNDCVEETQSYVDKLERAIVAACESSTLDLATMVLEDIYTDIKAREHE